MQIMLEMLSLELVQFHTSPPMAKSAVRSIFSLSLSLSLSNMASSITNVFLGFGG
jgi:hypothetical protein